MSVAAISWAWKQKTGSAETKVLLVVLANCTDFNGACWPSLEELAAETEMDAARVKTCLRELEAAGFIFGARSGHAPGRRRVIVLLSDDISRGYARTLGMKAA